MRTLVMDGVIPRRLLDLRPSTEPVVPISPAIMPEKNKTLSALVTPNTGTTIDGIKRYVPIAAAKPVVFSSSESAVREEWLDNTTDRRYHWAGIIAAGLIVPVLAISSGRLTELTPSSIRSFFGQNTVTTFSAPPVSDIQAAAISAPAAPQIDTDLQQLLSEFSAAQPAPFGIVIKDLTTGIVTGSNADKVFTSASLYKLFVAQTIYKQIDTAQLSLGDRVPGTGRNVADCLRVMINISDNECGRALGAMIGWSKADADLKNFGFKNTSLTNHQRTSAADVALLLDRLHNGTLLSPTSSEHFINLLKEQKVNNRLPVGLPTGTVIAHKTGDLNGFVHDAGIVYGQKTSYIIAMTSGPWSSPSVAPGVFADLSSKIFAHYSQ